MICQLKKLQSWLEGLFIMLHSEMELVVELLAVFSPSLSFSLHICRSYLSVFVYAYAPTDICLCVYVILYAFVPTACFNELIWIGCICNQFIMWDQMDGRSYLVMMLENSTTDTIRLCPVQWNRRWLK